MANTDTPNSDHLAALAALERSERMMSRGQISYIAEGSGALAEVRAVLAKAKGEPVESLSEFERARNALLNAVDMVFDVRGHWSISDVASQADALGDLHDAYTAFMAAAITAVSDCVPCGCGDASTFKAYMHDAKAECVPSSDDVHSAVGEYGIAAE